MMLIMVWALVDEKGSILAITINESTANAWRADGGKVEELSNAIKA